MFIASYKPSHFNREGKAFQFVTNTKEEAVVEMTKRGFTPRVNYDGTPTDYQESLRAEGLTFAHTQDYSIIRIRPIEVV